MTDAAAQKEPGVAAPPIDYAKGLAWTLAFNALTKVLLGVVSIYIARRLGPNEMGVFSLLSAIYIFAEQMREAGLKQAFYNDNQVTEARFRTYARLSVFSGAVFGLLLGLLSRPLAAFFSVPQLAWSVLWVALATMLNGLAAIPMAAMHKGGRFRDVGLIESASAFAAAAVSLALVLMGWGLSALVAQLMMRAGVLLALAYWQRPYSIFNHDREAVRGILRICTPLVATDVLWLLYSLADQFAIVRILGSVYGPAVATTANGFYGQGKRLLNYPSDILFFPLFRTVAVAIGNRSGDPQELGRTFVKAISLAVLLLGAFLGACAALRAPLIIALLTEKFSGTVPVFGIVCLSEAVKLIGAFAGSALVAAGKARIPLMAWLLPYPIAAAGVALTWSRVSLVTIAWSYAAGMVAVSVLVVACAFRVLHVQAWQLARFWQCLAMALATVGAAHGLSLLPMSPWPLLLLAAVVLPAFHLALIGTVLDRNPLAYFARSGLRRLRESV